MGFLARGGSVLGPLALTAGLGPAQAQALVASGAAACIKATLGAATVMFVLGLAPQADVDADVQEQAKTIVVTQVADIDAAVNPATDIRWEVECMALNVGDNAQIDFEIRVNGSLTNVSALSIQVTTPTGTIANYTMPSAELANVGTGLYRAVIDCTAEGTWGWRLVSHGPTGKGAERGKFNVEP